MEKYVEKVNLRTPGQMAGLIIKCVIWIKHKEPTIIPCIGLSIVYSTNWAILKYVLKQSLSVYCK